MTERVTAQARRTRTGKTVVHTVKLDGEVVGTRRSAGVYRYAICGWYDGRVIVKRWSRNPKASSREFAVPVAYPPTTHEEHR